MNGKTSQAQILQHYLQTSVYTYAGAYRQFLQSLPEDIPQTGRLVCGQITHPTLLYTAPSAYLEETYFGKFSAYPQHRFKDEDELYITAVVMIAGILRLDERGFTEGRDVTKRITVSCRQAAVLFSAILKAKGIPCRCRAGFMDFGNQGESYTEHWVNEYWSRPEGRWVLVDADGYYEYEGRFGYSQFDLPRRKFLPAAQAWLALRRGTLDKQLDLFGSSLPTGVCEYLFMDVHALMNNEIFYSYQPPCLRHGIEGLGEPLLQKLDCLATWMLEPDENFDKIATAWQNDEALYILTNNTQNIYEDCFSGAQKIE